MTEVATKSKELCVHPDCETQKDEGSDLCPPHQVGEGSPAGWRYFISCRFPMLRVTVTPAQMKTDTDRAKTGLYADFQSAPKPNFMQGNGRRERDSGDETDQNDSRKWGIYGPIYDPGPEPEVGGWKDDPATVDKKIRLKAAVKERNRKIIDVLRSTHHYQLTQQINEVDMFSKIAEVTWNPVPHSGKVFGRVTRRKITVNKDGKKIEEEFTPTAPTQVKAEAPKSNVPSLRRGGRATSA